MNTSTPDVGHSIRMYRLVTDFSYKYYDDRPFSSYGTIPQDTNDLNRSAEIIAMIPQDVDDAFIVEIKNKVIDFKNTKGMAINSRVVHIKWDQDIKPLSGKQQVWLIQLKYMAETSDENGIFVSYKYPGIHTHENTTDRGTVTTTSDGVGGGGSKTI